MSKLRELVIVTERGQITRDSRGEQFYVTWDFGTPGDEDIRPVPADQETRQYLRGMADAIEQAVVSALAETRSAEKPSWIQVHYDGYHNRVSRVEKASRDMDRAGISLIPLDQDTEVAIRAHIMRAVQA